MGLVGLYLGLRLDETPRFRLLLGYLALGAVMGCFVLPSFLPAWYTSAVVLAAAIAVPLTGESAFRPLDSGTFTRTG
jgi:hypothetical protein